MRTYPKIPFVEIWTTIITSIAAIAVMASTLQLTYSHWTKKYAKYCVVLLVQVLSMFSIPHLPEVRTVWLKFSDSLPLFDTKVVTRFCFRLTRLSRTSVHTELLTLTNKVVPDG